MLAASWVVGVGYGFGSVGINLLAEFGDSVAITYVMAGRARSFDEPVAELHAWLQTSATHCSCCT